MSVVGGRADENQAKADIIRQRPSCSPAPICRTAQLKKTDKIEEIQGTRNPFIDQPEIADTIRIHVTRDAF